MIKLLYYINLFYFMIDIYIFVVKQENVFQGFIVDDV